jgi:hypothetical protein
MHKGCPMLPWYCTGTEREKQCKIFKGLSDQRIRLCLLKFIAIRIILFAAFRYARWVTLFSSVTLARLHVSGNTLHELRDHISINHHHRMFGTGLWTFNTHKTFLLVQQFDWIIITKLNFALHLDRFNFKLNFKVTFVGDFNLAVNCLEWLKTRIDLKVRKSNFSESESHIPRWKKGQIIAKPDRKNACNVRTF